MLVIRGGKLVAVGEGKREGFESRSAQLTFGGFVPGPFMTAFLSLFSSMSMVDRDSAPRSFAAASCRSCRGVFVRGRLCDLDVDASLDLSRFFESVDLRGDRPLSTLSLRGSWRRFSPGSLWLIGASPRVGGGGNVVSITGVAGVT